MFINGQKVVCIDDVFPALVHKLYTALPKKDVVYVVRGMAPGVSAADLRSDEIAVYLIGLQNPCSNAPPHREMGFRAERFRPLGEMTVEEILDAVKPEEMPELVPVLHPRQLEVFEDPSRRILSVRSKVSS